MIEAIRRSFTIGLAVGLLMGVCSELPRAISGARVRSLPPGPNQAEEVGDNDEGVLAAT